MSSKAKRGREEDADGRPQKAARTGGGGAGPKVLRGWAAPRTALEQQFMKCKAGLPDTIVAVECGYRYKFFGRDAEIASELLGFYANQGEKDTYTSCSFPVQRLSVHTARLANNGYRVAHLAQAETNATRTDAGKGGLFERELVGLFSKATLAILASAGEAEAGEQDDNANNLLLVHERAIPKAERVGTDQVLISIVSVSLATGGFLRWDQFGDGPLRRELLSRLLHFDPVEVLASSDLSSATMRTLESMGLNYGVTPSTPETPPGTIRCEQVDPKQFQDKRDTVSSFFDSHPALKAEVAALPDAVVGCISVLIDQLALYKLEDFLFTRGTAGADKTAFRKFSELGFMHLPSETLTALEIFDVAGSGRKQGARVRGSLNWVVNTCRTGFGARKLRQWLSKPLLDPEEIRARQQAVFDIARGEHGAELQKFSQKILSSTPDLERILAKMSYGKASPKETLTLLTVIRGLMKAFKNSEVSQISAELSPLLTALLGGSDHDELLRICGVTLEMLNEEAAAANNKAELFLTEDIQFDELKSLEKDKDEQHAILKEHLQACRKQVRCPSLAYKHIGQTDFLLDVPNTSCQLVPKGWLQESKVAKSTRYHTPVIKQCIHKLQLAKDLLSKTSEKLFGEFQKKFVRENSRVVQGFIDSLGAFDCLTSFATLARDMEWCMPEIVTDAPGGHLLDITDGRHPVIDRILREQDKRFVPNHVRVRGSLNEQVMLVTGPNMGGKSSYLRQAALIVLLAQIGSFVPAVSARLSVFDAIYVRLGSHDSLLDGQSSFLVEITEAAAILQKATPQSLLVLDEIGRGTSTFDGIAIAHSMLEWLVTRVGCPTLFVTHYPEIVDLAPVFPKKLRTCHMSFMQADAAGDAPMEASAGEGGADDEGADTGSKVTFLYKLLDGTSPSSFGMNVARLAGISESVITTATERSRYLESIADASRESAQKTVKSVFAAVFLREELQRMMDAGVSADSLASFKQRISCIDPTQLIG